MENLKKFKWNIWPFGPNSYKSLTLKILKIRISKNPEILYIKNMKIFEIRNFYFKNALMRNS